MRYRDTATLFTCQYFRVVTLSDLNNHRTIWLERPDAVMIVPILWDENLLLVSQFRDPTGRSEIEFPGGGIEAGETLLEAAERELAEETGFKASEYQYISKFYPSNGTSTETVHIFKAKIAEQSKPSTQELRTLSMSRREIRLLIETGKISCALTALAYFIASGGHDEIP